MLKETEVMDKMIDCLKTWAKSDAKNEREANAALAQAIACKEILQISGDLFHRISDLALLAYLN